MLEGKTALISGGGTGIGRATGLRLAASPTPRSATWTLRS